ncbi:MAG TPA: carboxypeptidase-like regulatory domain-containing protein [Solirubrobacteraceae bacterium]|jgi:hypothetical protein
MLASLLVTASASAALQNPGFENGLAGWTATTVPNGGYYGAPSTERPATCRVPDGVCVLDHDGFDAYDGYGESVHYDVDPAEGGKMVRLGGPFTSSGQQQMPEFHRLEQTFTVAPGQTTLDLAFNAFTWDYSGYDELTFRVTLTGEDGDVLADRRFGSFGQGVSLKTTGWRPASLDLAGYEGREVTLRIQAGGTRDSAYGFWAYVDAGNELPPSPVGEPSSDVPATTPDGDPLLVNEQVDPATGLWWLTIPASQIKEFPPDPSFPGGGGCMPLSLDLPIDAGAGTVSQVSLELDVGYTRRTFPMDDPQADGTWSGTIDCVQTGQLSVAYTVTEGGEAQRFLVPIGGLALIDPQGVVYDKAAYDAARAGGASEEQARAGAAIQGATVRLQREVDGAFVNVLSGDPGIMPKVNPQITGANGIFQWDVSAGRYRVVVTKDGYDTVTSGVVDIPPPVLDLHIAMQRPRVGDDGNGGNGGNGGGGGGGESAPPDGAGPPLVDPPLKPGGDGQRPLPPEAPCAGLKGAAQRRCQADRRLAAALKRCGRLAARKRSACRAQAKGRARCERLATRQRKSCLARLKRSSRRRARRG